MTGELLRKLRGNKTAEEVAKDIGVSKSALLMYERGERTPRDEIKVSIAKYYHKTVEEIFFADIEY
jgi:DNA-binding XRE family transcriptional regulator